MGKILETADRGQRRIPVFGFPIGVFYKFMDDQGNYLAATITYYAFIAIFPLLLLASTIFGFILQGNQALQDQVLDSALSTFPIIGEKLKSPEGLTGSTSAVVVGSLAALYGSLGLGQAIQNSINTAWSVPRNSRPNPLILRLKSLLLLTTAGVAVLAVSIVSALGSNTQVFGSGINDTIGWAIRLATVLVVGLVLTLLFRVGAARRHHLSSSAPGAFATAAMWQLLQYIGTAYATRVLGEATAVNAVFALVLGLIGIIWIAAVMAVLGIEVNVVIARKLYPRALLTLFTDNVDLTDADRRAYASYAQRERHKGYESIQVVFEDRQGGTHEFPLPVISQERATTRTRSVPQAATRPAPSHPATPPASPPTSPALAAEAAVAHTPERTTP